MQDTFRPPSRVISLLIVIVYMGLSYAFRGAEGAMCMLGVCLFPLFCVWFPDVAGTQLGRWRGSLHRPTPPVVVLIGGWILLAMVPIAALIRFWNG